LALVEWLKVKALTSSPVLQKKRKEKMKVLVIGSKSNVQEGWETYGSTHIAYHGTVDHH
jgi:hypothetical protein